MIINSSGKEKWLPFDDQSGAHEHDHKHTPTKLLSEDTTRKFTVVRQKQLINKMAADLTDADAKIERLQDVIRKLLQESTKADAEIKRLQGIIRKSQRV